MLKTYQKYIIQNFLSKFILITSIFFALTVILGSLEEITFLKNLDTHFLYPYFLTLLNTPITLFEIFPFIILLTTQFVFYSLIKKDELNLFKTNGLTNFNLIKIVFFISIFIGIFNVVVFYNLASNSKFYYSNIKNTLSDDNKYLAMVTKSGLWIKDEVENKKLIIKSKFIKDNFISKTIINEYDNNFNLIRVIQSDKINIKDNEWVIYNPIITKDNVTEFTDEKLLLQTNFNYEKITKIFSNISTLDISKLFDLKNDYEKLGYSSDEIYLQLLKLLTVPALYGILVIVASIVVFSISNKTSLIFQTTIGFLVSVIIYYLIFFSTSLGTGGKIPLELSIFFPILILSIICTIGLIDINEK